MKTKKKTPRIDKELKRLELIREADRKMDLWHRAIDLRDVDAIIQLSIERGLYDKD